MALQNVPFNSKTYIDACGCSDIELCLSAAGAVKAGGATVIPAVLQHNPRVIGNGSPLRPDLNKRCLDLIQYTVQVDDAILAVDPGTGLPFKLDGCADIDNVKLTSC